MCKYACHEIILHMLTGDIDCVRGLVPYIINKFSFDLKDFKVVKYRKKSILVELLVHNTYVNQNITFPSFQLLQK